VTWGPRCDHEHDGARAHLSAEAKDAAVIWLAWAKEAGELFPFTSPRQRRIWTLYADGIPLTQINIAVGGSRRSITKAIHRVTLAHPPPIPNPWRKSGRDQVPTLRLVPREDDEDMAPTSPKPLLTYKAIKMFRNYDGSKGGFGDTSIAATGPNPDNLSTFASQDSATGTVKVMVVSKVLTGTTPVTVNVANFTGGTAAQVWQLTASNAITHLANATISNGKTVTLTVPAQSVTLLVLPKAAVTPPPTVGTGLKGSYFANMALTGRATFIRTDGVVDFSWGSAAPAPMLPADHFSVRWEGQVSAPVAGPYTFYTLSDDGVRLWVNGVQLINNWTNHGPTTDMAKASVMLTAGQKVSIKLEYYENTAGADAHLYWTYPNQPKQVVPKACLYPAP